jgi:aryl-alcohol dehydrogenase-like predicted oxidoreductase
MGMSGYYGFAGEPRPENGASAGREAVETIRYAVERGIDFLDTADVYGPFANEELVGEAIRGRRERLVLATKFGFETTAAGVRVNGRPEYVRAACEASLGRLGVESVDLLYLPRVDPDVPIEETVGAMAELVAEGKVGHLGLSEAGAETIRHAHAVHPLAAVQSEFSLWSRDPEARIFPTLRELGIGFVPYAPLGRGLFAGAVASLDELVDDDFRRTLPRFQDDNLAANLELARRLRACAEERETTPARLALAWVLAQGDFVVPIVGTTKRDHLDEDLGAIELDLDPEAVRTIEDAVPAAAVAGARYSDMSLLE